VRAPIVRDLASILLVFALLAAVMAANETYVVAVAAGAVAMAALLWLGALQFASRRKADLSRAPVYVVEGAPPPSGGVVLEAGVPAPAAVVPPPIPAPPAAIAAPPSSARQTEGDAAYLFQRPLEPVPPAPPGTGATPPRLGAPTLVRVHAEGTGWRVVVEPSGATTGYRTKNDAVVAATSVAREAGTRLVVHRRDGAIQSDRDFAPKP
jgi:hypothetical protein